MASLSRRTLLTTGIATLGLASASVAHQAWLLNQVHAMPQPSTLPIIPFFDIRNIGLVNHAQTRLPQMMALREACIGPLTPVARLAMQQADRMAKGWLEATGTPFAEELAAIAAISPEKGIYLLSSSYEWGCTTLAAPEPAGQGARLLRTLDWPFAGLGRHVEVLRQRGPAGEFLNITWPGAVGILSALAPGRFAATINQAPSRVGTGLYVVDAVYNSGKTYFKKSAIPSMHVLRQVFETAPDFATARRMLEQTPIAAPTIFTLVGLTPEETCVIERTENQHLTHMGASSAANSWAYSQFGGKWLARGGEGDGDPRGDSDERRGLIERFSKDSSPFAWVQPPVRNETTRLAVEMNPSLGTLRLRGYEEMADEDDAAPATADLLLDWYKLPA